MNATPHHEDHPHLVSRNARYGLVLFAVYVLLYGGFIVLAVFRSGSLGADAIGGVNLAIVYGFSLIGGALVLALIYWWLCRKPMHGTPHDAGAAAEDAR